MIDVLAKIDALEQRLRQVSRSRLLFAASLLAIFVLTPLFWLDPEDWLHLLGALATLIAGTTGLVKALQLWWRSTESGKQAIESEAVQALEYELAVKERELHICQEAVGIYETSRFNPEHLR